jgi:hypothetical protein
LQAGSHIINNVSTTNAAGNRTAFVITKSSRKYLITDYLLFVLIRLGFKRQKHNDFFFDISVGWIKVLGAFCPGKR